MEKITRRVQRYKYKAVRVNMEERRFEEIEEYLYTKVSEEEKALKMLLKDESLREVQILEHIEELREATLDNFIKCSLPIEC